MQAIAQWLRVTPFVASVIGVAAAPIVLAVSIMATEGHASVLVIVGCQVLTGLVFELILIRARTPRSKEESLLVAKLFHLASVTAILVAIVAVVYPFARRDLDARGVAFCMLTASWYFNAFMRMCRRFEVRAGRIANGAKI